MASRTFPYLGLFIALSSCSSEPNKVEQSNSSQGGGSATTSSGGASAAGGATAVGGSVSAGGASSTVGAGGTSSAIGGTGANTFGASGGVGGSGAAIGGQSAVGGVTNAGGATASNTVGTTNIGGSSASGGTTNKAGSTAVGGTFGSGGATNMGGSSTAGTSNKGGSASGGASSGGTAGQSSGGTTTCTPVVVGGSSSGGTTSTAAAVRIVGRTASSTNGQRFSWPGVHFMARFTGTQAFAQLNDSTNKNRFEVIVDNGAPKSFTTASGQTSYQLVSGLTSGTHEVVLWRNTDAYVGVTEFVGISNFGTGGALVAPSPAPDRRIELVGDSITVGAGVEGTSTSCTADSYTNNYFAYGSVAGRILDADVVTIAYSGIGAALSYDDGTARLVMKDRYDTAVTNDNSAWNFTKFQPHVVVLNLGTNDYNAGVADQTFIDAYVSLVKHIRSKYANAYFICVIQAPASATPIRTAVDTVTTGGDTKIEVFDIQPFTNSNSCASHPDMAGQQAMGESLAARIKTLMCW